MIPYAETLPLTPIYSASPFGDKQVSQRPIPPFEYIYMNDGEAIRIPFTTA